MFFLLYIAQGKKIIKKNKFTNIKVVIKFFYYVNRTSVVFY